ncbi:MAG: hypothetical protein HUU50_20080 [Candidatus Brocadiae bacterium]|nr:hypothetical protein [Candidatus Brocadiia bacterium]
MKKIFLLCFFVLFFSIYAKTEEQEYGKITVHVVDTSNRKKGNFDIKVSVYWQTKDGREHSSFGFTDKSGNAILKMKKARTSDVIYIEVGSISDKWCYRLSFPVRIHSEQYIVYYKGMNSNWQKETKEREKNYRSTGKYYNY